VGTGAVRDRYIAAIRSAEAGDIAPLLAFAESWRTWLVTPSSPRETTDSASAKNCVSKGSVEFVPVGSKRR